MNLPTPTPFYDRADEVRALERAWNQPGGRMALLYGRRRLGKTYLLQRFFTAREVGFVDGTASPRPHCYYLADQTTAAQQRLELAVQLLDALPDPGVAPEEIAVSWNALLRFAAARARADYSPGDGQAVKGGGRFGLVLDEFPYLVEQSPDLPSILQAWWDREGLHSPLFVVLCGSQLSAMSALGRESQPLYGRFNAGILKLEPLGYEDAADFYADAPGYGPAEALTLYGVFGGTPRYHALVDPSRPPAEEIVDLLLRAQGPLASEVQFLLGSQQVRDPAPYNAVLGAIAAGTAQYNQILTGAGVEAGSFPRILRLLTELGWILRELPFGETSERRALYRVGDPFLGFWYRFVAPLASALHFSDAARVYADQIAPRLPGYLGGQVFETVCHQWLRRHGQDALGLTVTRAGRYWSRDGQLEIDVMAELADGTHLFGECKWSADRPIGMGVYHDLIAKAGRLPRPGLRRDASYALFCVGGFTPDLAAMAAAPGSRLHLVGPLQLLPRYADKLPPP